MHCGKERQVSQEAADPTLPSSYSGNADPLVPFLSLSMVILEIKHTHTHTYTYTTEINNA